MSEAYDFGLILQKLRKERGMSQAQLAKRIHKESSIISRYENNLQNPTFETVCALARIFGVSIDYLAGNQDSSSLSTHNLTPKQCDILNELASLFRLHNTDAAKMNAEKQYRLIERIVLEFAD